MTVIDFTAGDMFIVRIQSSLVSDPAVKWFNTYEIRAKVAGGDLELRAVVDTLGLGHEHISLNHIHVDKGLVSTWVPDSNPYNPLAFLVHDINGTGDRAPVGDVLPLRIPLSIRREVQAGRRGTLFLRGLLVEADVLGTGQEFAMAPGAIAGWLALVNTFSTDLGGGGGAITPEFDSVMISGEAGDPEIVYRFVTDYTLGKPTSVSVNHKYFDRAA